MKLANLNKNAKNSFHYFYQLESSIQLTPLLTN